MASQTSLVVGKRLKFPTSEGFIELINHHITIVFSIRHLLNVKLVFDCGGKDLSIYLNSSLSDMYIYAIWDHRA